MSTPRHLGPFSLRLISWNGPNGPHQMNVVCTNCNGQFSMTHIFELEGWIKYGCPDIVVDLKRTPEGDLDIVALADELQKRRLV